MTRIVSGEKEGEMSRRRAPKPRTEKTVATLVLEVSYDTLPDTTDLNDLIEKARELGGVDKAEFTIHKTSKMCLV